MLTSIVFRREAVMGTVVGSCEIPSAVVDTEIDFDVEPDPVESDADIAVVVGSCVLTSAVVRCEVVVGIDVVAFVVLDSDLETVIDTNCVLP